MAQEITKSQQEQAILKEFEELGYEYEKNQDSHQFIDYEKEKVIVINSEIKSYAKCDADVRWPLYVTSKEHQLLHQLFEIWGWFDEK